MPIWLLWRRGLQEAYPDPQWRHTGAACRSPPPRGTAATPPRPRAAPTAAGSGSATIDEPTSDLRVVEDYVVLGLGGNESAQLCGLGQQCVAVRAAQLGERLDAQCLVADLPGALPHAVGQEGTGRRAVTRRERHGAVVEDHSAAVLV